VTLAAAILGDEALRATPGGFELDLHLNWYRSLPLSCVKAVELTVSGEPVRRDEITFVVNGRELSLDELAELWDEVWFVLDAATVRVARPLVTAGERAEVRLRLVSRIPYILVAPDTPLEYASERTRTLVTASGGG
jgi:Domain of unknown function (DUF6379)